MVKKTKTTSDAERRIIDSALHLAATQGWRYVTMDEIAKQAAMTLSEVQSLLPTKGALMGLLTRRIDRLVLEQTATDETDESERERLFDMLMNRFDLLAPYREGIAALLQANLGDPCALLAQLCNVRNSMKLTLQAAGISTAGPFGAIRIKGLCGIYLLAFKTWLKDDSPDMSKTMATLDRLLSQAECIARRLPGA